jgi:hypothetical protein
MLNNRSIFVGQCEGGLAVHPLSACKVGEGDGLVAEFDRQFAERGDGAPCRGVVDVLWCRGFAFDGFDKGVNDEEVHAAVACAFGFAVPTFPERVIVFVEPGFGGIPVIVLGLTFDIDAVGDVHP